MGIGTHVSLCPKTSKQKRRQERKEHVAGEMKINDWVRWLKTEESKIKPGKCSFDFTSKIKEVKYSFVVVLTIE